MGLNKDFENMSSGDKLKYFQEKFERSYGLFNTEDFDSRELIYLGTHEVDRNINLKNAPSKKANNVVNMTYELIETMVDSAIPEPAVQSKRPAQDENAKVIEDTISNYMNQIDMNRINDECERITSIHGYSVLRVDWNNEKGNHLYNGEIDVSAIHPKRLIPQPGIWYIEEMDYFFILTSDSRKQVEEEYNVTVVDDTEQYPDINSLGGRMNSYGSENEKVTKIECWYKDKKGDVGKYVWVNDQELEDVPKYYMRKLSRCKKCGETEGACECKNPKFEVVDQKEETTTEDIILSSGEVLPKGSKIPYYTPRSFPVIMRLNIPQSFRFGGQSDVDVIRDQQDAIKKVVTAIEEKIIRGGAIVKALDTHNVNLSNQLYQIVKGNMQELNALNVLNLQAEIRQDLEFAQYMYQSARSTLGITDSFQGKPDATAQSGKAKQIQVQQSTGRLQSKLFNKYEAYRKLFERVFELLIAFTDELRPYQFKNAENKTEYGYFDKYRFLERDAAGELFYNTDFLFFSDAGQGLPRDKMYILDKTLELYKLKVFDQLMVLDTLSDLRFPNAQKYKSQVEARMNQIPPVGDMLNNVPQAPGQPQTTQPMQQVGQAPETQSGALSTQLPPGFEDPNIQNTIKQWYLSLQPDEKAQFDALGEEEKANILTQMVQQFIGGGGASAT